MDAFDLANNLASYLLGDARDEEDRHFGRDGQFPSVADTAAWDRLTAQAAKMAKELGVQLEGCEYDRPCAVHPEDFLMRTVKGPFGETLTFTCACQEWTSDGYVGHCIPLNA
jgi:hypothetical protein